MTPPEIVAWLNEKFWGGEYEVRIQERSEAPMAVVHL